MDPSFSSDWRAEDAPASPSASPQSTASTQRRSRGGVRQATLGASLLAVAVFGGLIGFAADRWASGGLNRAVGQPVAAAPTGAPPAPTPVPTVGTSPRVGARAGQDGGPTATPSAAAASDPQQVAVQQVIRKADDEQQQAFTSNDPTVMADTSTPDFYQQQVQINADMQNNGISAIKLITIEWGQIDVNGSDATATVWETWSTTYSDGTTEQSRDRNVYTLVQDNGTWKVSVDDHPDDPMASVGAGSPGAQPQPSTGQTQPTTPGSRRVQPSTPNQPRGTQPGGTQPGGTQPTQPRGPRGSSTNTSQNWSGYSASGGTYTAVSGTWTVPQFAADSNAGADAAWVGIGGVNSRDLIQAGTQQTVSGSGSTQYEAWVEMLPQTSHPVPLTVNPGDSVTVSITQQPQAQDKWLIALKNNTTSQSFQVTETYTSSTSSAEWIEEAPSAARGRQVPLDNFGSISFSAGSAVKNGQTVSISGAGATPITMVGRGGQSMATPSALGQDGASFTVTHA